ncbi:MAG: hypothetical protein ABIO75_08270 [Thermomonas sp.]
MHERFPMLDAALDEVLAGRPREPARPPPHPIIDKPRNARHQEAA